MAAVDPLDALQAGVYTLLAADTALTVTLGASVYDGVPESASLPWVVVGEATALPDGVHGREGRQVSLTVHSWARADGMKKVNDMGARVVALLWHRHTALNAVTVGHTVWRVEHEFTQTLDDVEPHVRHRVDRFRVWTVQT